MGHDLLSLDFEELSIGSAVSRKTQSNFGKYSNLVSGFPSDFSIWPTPRMGVSPCGRMPARQTSTQRSTSAVEKVQPSLPCPDGEREAREAQF